MLVNIQGMYELNVCEIVLCFIVQNKKIKIVNYASNRERLKKISGVSNNSNPT